jgi:hypothetical protein
MQENNFMQDNNVIQDNFMIVGEAAMMNETRQVSSAKQSAIPGSNAGILMAAAGILMLLGLMIQFGELGLGPFTRDTFWIIPFLANGLWNILVTALSRTAFATALPYWPLTLVLAGSAALFLLSSRNSIAVEQESGRRSDYGR